jgi:lipopolysaccharide transport system ATP-binding protein
LSPNLAIGIRNLGKCYQIYEKSIDRLKQSFWRGRRRFFREFWAVQNISINIELKETVGIVGSNGSGKSTLLQLICNILTPTVGEIEVRGRVSALLELGSGFNPEFTGRENININAAIMGLTPKEIRGRFEDIVDFADIGNFIDQPVKTYSSGMYVRLAFASAINVSPDILLVDEALSVGDIRFQQKCMAKMKSFCKSGTVLFVSHDPSAILEFCSRAIWIERGEVRMDGKPKFVIEKYLQFMYEGETEDKHVTYENHLTHNSVSDMTGFSLIGNGTRQFGDFRVTIKGTRITTPQGYTSVLYGGQFCKIDIILQAHADIQHPIVGFIVKDRMGRELFGDNNVLMRQSVPSLIEGQDYLVSFSITSWPDIKEDDYLLTVAVAEGSMEQHTQCHYVHDALVFRSIPIRKAVGIFFVPDARIVISPINLSLSDRADSQLCS